MHRPVYLSLGSNLGDRKKLLSTAIKLVEENCGQVESESSIYRSKAWGFEAQTDFLNQVIEINTGQAPEQLLKEILAIEEALGRVRGSVRWQERTIDIDILFFMGMIIDTSQLTIPHPRIAVRNFTLVPLLEIAPHFVHPVMGMTIEELYLQCTDPLEVQMIEC
ncbi:MAG: 2-amino-4-hydroxy-6-hydroxymethyldihydropteridine diphosphokinase [Saprospiraceae bacterium]|nr:2-amino-4-hydroxy-6-hydroxymethyldihydropteridine diphosphokinase [Saprospiraceae bacterium]